MIELINGVVTLSKFTFKVTLDHQIHMKAVKDIDNMPSMNKSVELLINQIK